MKRATRTTVMAVAVAFLSLSVALLAGITAVWLTGEVRVLGLVMLPTGIVASLLVVYFDWRASLRRRIVSESDDYQRAA